MGTSLVGSWWPRVLGQCVVQGWEQTLLPALAWPVSHRSASLSPLASCIAACNTGTREKLRALVSVCCTLVGADVANPQRSCANATLNLMLKTLISASFLNEVEKVGVVGACVLLKHPEGFAMHGG